MTLFERIKELSKSKDKSLQDIALELGFSINIFYKWKNSEPKARDLEKVADYFGVTTDYLLGRTENTQPASKKDSPEDLKAMVDNAMSFDGKPLSEHDKDVILSYLEGRFGEK